MSDEKYTLRLYLDRFAYAKKENRQIGDSRKNKYSNTVKVPVDNWRPTVEHAKNILNFYLDVDTSEKDRDELEKIVLSDIWIKETENIGSHLILKTFIEMLMEIKSILKNKQSIPMKPFHSSVFKRFGRFPGPLKIEFFKQTKESLRIFLRNADLEEVSILEKNLEDFYSGVVEYISESPLDRFDMLIDSDGLTILTSFPDLNGTVKDFICRIIQLMLKRTELFNPAENQSEEEEKKRMNFLRTLCELISIFNKQGKIFEYGTGELLKINENSFKLLKMFFQASLSRNFAIPLEKEYITKEYLRIIELMGMKLANIAFVDTAFIENPSEEDINGFKHFTSLAEDIFKDTPYGTSNPYGTLFFIIDVLQKRTIKNSVNQNVPGYNILKNALNTLTNLNDPGILSKNIALFAEILKEKAFAEDFIKRLTTNKLLYNNFSSRRIIKGFQMGIKDLNLLEKFDYRDFSFPVNTYTDNNDFANCLQKIIDEGKIEDIAYSMYALSRVDKTLAACMVDPYLEKFESDGTLKKEFVSTVQRNSILAVYAVPLGLLSENFTENQQIQIAKGIFNLVFKWKSEELKECRDHNYRNSDNSSKVFMVILDILGYAENLSQKAAAILIESLMLLEDRFIMDFISKSMNLYPKTDDRDDNNLKQYENSMVRESENRLLLLLKTGFLNISGSNDKDERELARFFTEEIKIIDTFSGISRFDRTFLNNLDERSIQKLFDRLNPNSSSSYSEDHFKSALFLIEELSKQITDSRRYIDLDLLEQWRESIISDVVQKSSLSEVLTAFERSFLFEEKLVFSKNLFDTKFNNLKTWKKEVKHIKKEREFYLSFMLFLSCLQDKNNSIDKTLEKELVNVMEHHNKELITMTLDSVFSLEPKKQKKVFDVVRFVSVCSKISKKTCIPLFKSHHSAFLFKEMYEYLKAFPDYENKTLKIFCKFLSGPGKAFNRKSSSTDINESAFEKNKDNFFKLAGLRLASEKQLDKNSSDFPDQGLDIF